MRVVITADQRRSRRVGDRVPAALDTLNVRPPAAGGRPFERTAGDEIQGVPADAEAAIGAVEVLLRGAAWTVGIGIGDVDAPLPVSTRAGSGPAFVLARHAVEVAKGRPGRLAVAAHDVDAAASLETVLLLWADVVARRTPRGWEVADLLDQGLTQAEVAGRLGLSGSAVSQRAAAAGLTLSARGRRLAVDLLGGMLGGRDDGEASR